MLDVCINFLHDMFANIVFIFVKHVIFIGARSVEMLYNLWLLNLAASAFTVLILNICLKWEHVNVRTIGANGPAVTILWIY